MPRASEKLPPEIRRPFARLRRRSAVLELARAVAWTTVTAAVFVTIALALDRYLILSHGARVALTASAVALVTIFASVRAGLLVRASLPLRSARRIEAAIPELDEALLTIVGLARDPRLAAQASPSLLRLLEHRTAQVLQAARPARRIPAGPAVRSALAAALAITPLLSAAALWPRETTALARRFLHPATDLPRPSSTRLRVHPGDVTVARGSELEITVEVLAGLRSAGALAWQSDSNTELEQQIFPPPAAGSASDPGTRLLVRRFPPLEEGLRYRVQAGDWLGRWHRVEVRDPPRPESVEITLHHPAYADLRDEVLTASTGGFRAVEGSAVSIVVHASEPLRRATAELVRRPDQAHAPGGEPRAPAPRHALVVDGSIARSERLPLAVDLVAWQLELTATDGVQSAQPYRYSVDLWPDRPPKPVVTSPRGAEILVEPTSALTVSYDARDDVGLSELRLVFDARTPDDEPSQKGANGAIVQLLERVTVGGVRTLAGAHVVDIAALALAPGASASFVLEATDRRGQSAQTSPRLLRCVEPPQTPEGVDWLAKLARLAATTTALAADAAALSPGSAGEAMNEGEPAPFAMASAEELALAADATLGLLARLDRAAAEATDIARSIAIASPHVDGMVGLSRRLATLGRGAGTELWTELEATRAQPARAATGAQAIAAFQQSLTAGLRRTATVAVTIRRAEVLEDLTSRAVALEREQKELERRLAAAAPGPGAGRRPAHLLVRATRLAAELAACAGWSSDDDSSGPERLAEVATSFTRTVIPALDRVVQAVAADRGSAAREAKRILGWAREELETEAERATATAFEVERRWAADTPVERSLEALARALAASASSREDEATAARGRSGARDRGRDGDGREPRPG